MGYQFTVVPAQPGSDALLLEFPTTITNNGYIGGGGGGGGGSGETGGSNSNNCPGGGGAGINPGAGGDVTWSANYRYVGYNGTETAGGLTSYDNPYQGKGGDLGQPGASGGSIGSSQNFYGPGAAPGRSIVNVGYLIASTGLVPGRLLGPTA
jgi:hypothetical protein